MDHEKRMVLRKKDAMSFSYSPIKGVFSTGLMLWMSGSSVQIFSIYATGNALIQPISAMTNMSNVFKKFEMDGLDLTVPKLIYSGMQLVLLAIALWKLNSMGLVPMTSADWTSYIPIREVTEEAGMLL